MGIFKVQHQDPFCREQLCLPDYEQAFQTHQELMFQRMQRQRDQWDPNQVPMLSSPARFRSNIWGEGSYADRIWVRVTPNRAARAEGMGYAETFRLSDIAQQGIVPFPAVQDLLGIGSVEFIVPNYFCGAETSARGYSYLTVRNRRDFEGVIRELDQLRPMHGEGMGNVFWFRCMPETSDSGANISVASEPSAGASLHVMMDQAMAVLASDLPCDEDDIAYFDEDTGRAVCDSEENPDGNSLAPLQSQVGAMTSGLLVSMSELAVHSLATGFQQSAASFGSAMGRASMQMGLSAECSEAEAGTGESEPAP